MFKILKTKLSTKYCLLCTCSGNIVPRRDCQLEFKSIQYSGMDFFLLSSSSIFIIITKICIGKTFKHTLKEGINLIFIIIHL